MRLKQINNCVDCDVGLDFKNSHIYIENDFYVKGARSVSFSKLAMVERKRKKKRIGS